MPQQAISTRIAQIYKTAYGRGPTKIAAYLLPELVVVLIEDLNTQAQGTLLDAGQDEHVETSHRRLYESMASDMSTAVEGVLGRTVRGCVAGFNARLNAATTTFLLDPSEQV